MTQQRLLTQRQYANHVGLTQQAISKMVRAGRIPSVHGRIDLAAADRALAGGTVGTVTLAEAQRRKELAIAGLRELELEQKRGELCEVAYVERSLVKIYSNIRSHLLNLPVKLAPRLEGLIAVEIRVVLETEVRQALEELVMIASA
jgi:phage terminase Nu1 subunit (DNA packaging protein)